MVLGSLLSCRGLGGARPRLAPMPGSVARSVAITADSATRALAAALAARQVPVVLVDPAEGYVESAWYDVVLREPTHAPVRRLEHVVKLRFFSDPLGGQTRVVGEAVRRVILDPSLPERDLERVVPDDHPGRILLDSVMARALPADTARNR